MGRPNFGRLVEMCSDLVRRHGKIFVSSAGNQGPALTSCSAPGSTTPALIGVGAYLSSAMKKTAYSMYPISSGDKSSKTSTANAPSEDDPQNIQSMLPAQQYSFSSRGPSVSCRPYKQSLLLVRIARTHYLIPRAFESSFLSLFLSHTRTAGRPSRGLLECAGGCDGCYPGVVRAGRTDNARDVDGEPKCCRQHRVPHLRPSREGDPILTLLSASRA